MTDITRAQIDAADAYFRSKGGKHLPGGFFWCELLEAVQSAAPTSAAAPSLLEALEAVVRVADRKTVEFDMAHAAIAAARGES